VIARGTGVRRRGPLALVLLLVAVVSALGISAPLHGPAVAVDGRADAAAVAGSRGDAVSPDRVAGRPAAQPSLVCEHGKGDGVPVGAAPAGIPSPATVSARGGHASVIPVAPAAHRMPAGVRAPPVWQSDL
jgi:hypothetical protein